MSFRLSSLSFITAPLVDQVTGEFVHRLFPSLRMPAFVACPDDATTATLVVAITLAAAARGVTTEYLDLRPAPVKHLDEVTARLRAFGESAPAESSAPIGVLILDGFDLLEGEGHDAPIYPFRSRFQFDREHLWLFLGRDWRRLCRLFGTYRLPLYHAASDLTPEPWRAIVP